MASQGAGQAPSAAATPCPICGSSMYATDWGNCEVTYHCSSPEARFWDFDRGTKAQHIAKEHWDQSLREVFFSREDKVA